MKFAPISSARSDAPSRSRGRTSQRPRADAGAHSASFHAGARPGARALEVSIDETRIADNLAFGQSTTYQTVSGGDHLGRIVPIVLTDDRTPPPTGQAKFRAMHTAPTADAVDVYVTAPGVDITTATPTFPNLSFGTAAGRPKPIAAAALRAGRLSLTIL